MRKGRLEAFSDGVVAIIITIMVLEMKIPETDQLADLEKLWPVFLSYILSFVNIGLYWNNHHHLFQAVEKIDGRVLWANTHLLFWLSLVPFATGWMGEHHFTLWPIALYGVVLMMAGVAYYLLVRSLMAIPGNPKVAKAIGNDRKGKLSVLLYIIAIPLAFISPAITLALYITVAAIWFIPDRRIEKLESEL
jgi:uncharacterized membrane protein